MIERGWPDRTPVGVVLGASTTNAAAWTTTLAGLRFGIEPVDREGPGTLVIGQVVSLRSVLAVRLHNEAAMATIEQRDAPSAGSAEWGRARLSFADQADIDEFVAVLGRFERGEIGPDEWRTFRPVRGTYGQRQADDAQMLRVKIPQGILTPGQLDALADVAERYSRGFGHITTRQNVQFHFVRLHDVEHAMRHLADAGLTTRR